MYKIKRFSIQSGGPSNPASLKTELTNRVKAGAILGGSVGLLTGGMIKLGGGSFRTAGIVSATGVTIGTIAGLLTSLGASMKRATATKLTMNDILDKIDEISSQSDRDGNRISEINPFRYIDTDENPKKYNVTFSYLDGIMIIILNKPSNSILNELNEDLEEMIKFNRKSGYSSEETDTGYIVSATIPNLDTACGLIYNLIYECRIKVNCITNNSLTGKL